MSAAAAKGERTAQQLAEGLVERARSAGADEADAVASVSTESSVTVRMQKVEKIIEAGSRSVGLRVIMGGRQAVVSTSDISDAALDETVARALELALIAEPDEFAGLPEASETAGSGGSLQLYDEAIELVTTQDRIDRAMACEHAALDADERISNSDGASFSTQVSEMALANSNGFSGSYPTSSASLSVEVMAAEPDGRLRNDYWFTSERQLHRLADGAAVGREAAARALRQLGAEKTSTRQVPVVWEATMAAGLLGTVARAADGEAFFRRSTFFADREGEAVASSLVTIVDDATLAGQLGSRPFDGEGIATRRNVLVYRVGGARGGKSAGCGNGKSGDGGWCDIARGVDRGGEGGAVSDDVDGLRDEHRDGGFFAGCGGPVDPRRQAGRAGDGDQRLRAVAGDAVGDRCGGR
jgi:PmbA protein